MIDERSMKKVSRRRFLRGAAFAAPGIAAATSLNAWSQTNAAIPRKWAKETDVVILGTGFAGLSAAITAKDAGAKVLILEKMPQKYEGGNSRVSGNMWWTPTNLPEARQYMEGLSLDSEFARPRQSLVPLERPPFYCVKLYPATFNTQGGPRRNAKCQVVDPDSQPIKRLYSAGELGSFWGWMYNGGGNNAEALCTGQIAGRNAAAAKTAGKTD